MNPRELLARLNVPAVRYEIGRGGIPKLTNLDIAAALGMVRDAFDRDIVSAVWWPDGAMLLGDSLAERVRLRLMTEYSKREREYYAAKLELHMVDGEIEAHRCKTEENRRIKAEHVRKLEQARDNRWPWNPEVYPRIFPSIIGELRNPQRCAMCEGRGQVKIDATIKTCRKCDGSGLRAETRDWRASQLKIQSHQFRNTWQKIYEWVYELIASAERRGVLQLAQALMDEDDEGAT